MPTPDRNRSNIIDEAGMIVYGPKRLRCTPQEVGRRGRQWYEEIRLAVEGEHHGKVIAIDEGTGEFEVSKDGISGLSQSLYSRVPDAEIWFARIGFDGHERSRKIREQGCPNLIGLTDSD